MPHDTTPYLHVIDMPRQMSGKGAPRDTVSGVLGHTTGDSEMRSLGGLVKDTKASAAAPPVMKDSKVRDKSEHKVAGKTSATHIPGAHYGQVPYVGQYMSELGKRLS